MSALTDMVRFIDELEDTFGAISAITVPEDMYNEIHADHIKSGRGNSKDIYVLGTLLYPDAPIAPLIVTKCECGSDSVNGGSHSYWCAKYSLIGDGTK